jgi:hypothetical protein
VKKWKKKKKPPMEEGDEVVRLNVGGRLFCVTKEILLGSDDDNFFSSLLSGRIPSKKLDDAYFIDRDSEAFEYILRYLRNGSVEIPDHLTSIVRQEADFFLVPIPFTKKLHKGLQDVKSGGVYFRDDGSMVFFRIGSELFGGSYTPPQANHLNWDDIGFSSGELWERGGFVFCQGMFNGQISPSGDVLVSGSRATLIHVLHPVVLPDERTRDLRHKFFSLSFQDGGKYQAVERNFRTGVFGAQNRQSLGEGVVQKESNGLLQVRVSCKLLISKLPFLSRGTYGWRLEERPSSGPSYQIEYPEDDCFPVQLRVEFIALGNGYSRIVRVEMEEGEPSVLEGCFKKIVLRGVEPPALTTAELHVEIVKQIKHFYKLLK